MPAGSPVRCTSFIRRLGGPAGGAVALAGLISAAFPVGAHALPYRLRGSFTLGSGANMEIVKTGVAGVAYQPAYSVLLGAGEDGRLLAAWMGDDTRAEVSSGSATAWQPSVPVGGSGGAFGPHEQTGPADSAFGPGGAALLSWVSGTAFSPGADTGISALSATGGSWAEQPGPVPLTGGESAPAVAFDPRGDAYAAWVANLAPGSGYPEVLDASIQPAGGAWRAPVAISVPPPWRILAPRIGVDAAGDAIVTWMASDPGGNAVYAATYTPTGGWRAPITLGEGTNPAVAVRTGAIAVLAWDGPGEMVDAAQVNLASGHWGRARSVGGSRGANGRIAISIGPRGASALSWTEYDSAGNGQHRARVAVNLAARRVRAQTLATWPLPPLSVAGQVEHPFCFDVAPASLAYDPRGNLTAAWAEDCGPVDVRRRSARTRRWSAPVDVRPLLGSATGPQLAFDSSGELVAAWIESSPVPGTPFYREYESVPLPSEVTTSVHAAVLSPR